MTDFVMSPNTAVTFENLEWDLTPPGQRKTFGGTLAVAAFTAAQHFPDGFLKSGLVVALATSGAFSGLLVPYLNAVAPATGPGETAVGILVHSVPVTRQQGGSNRAKIGVAFMVAGTISVSKLPYTAANAASGGFLDTPGRVDLPLIHYAA